MLNCDADNAVGLHVGRGNGAAGVQRRAHPLDPAGRAAGAHSRTRQESHQEEAVSLFTFVYLYIFIGVPSFLNNTKWLLYPTISVNKVNVLRPLGIF